jgi:hypothetical protein
MFKISRSFWVKASAPPWCPICGFTVLDLQELINFSEQEPTNFEEEDWTPPLRLPLLPGAVPAGQYKCLRCGYQFVTPEHVMQLLYKFAEKFGHFPTLLEAPPEYFYTLTNSVLGRAVVARMEQVEDLGTGEKGEAKVTIGEGRPTFVPKAGQEDRRASLLQSLEKGLELQVVPQPHGSPFAACDEWGRCIWSQEERQWLQDKDPPSEGATNGAGVPPHRDL